VIHSVGNLASLSSPVLPDVYPRTAFRLRTSH
jgi:hypothetical protein